MGRHNYYYVAITIFNIVLFAKYHYALETDNKPDESFMGLWYLQKSSGFTKETCITFNFTKSWNTNMNIYMQVSNNSSKIKDNDLQQFSEKSYLVLHKPFKISIIYVVVDTDYNDYLILWKRKNFFVFSKDIYYVLTRERFPTEEILDKANNALAYGGITKKTILYNVRQNDCLN